jgi:hypothetical protein
MKDWHKLKPELFKKQPYYLPGCDTYARVRDVAEQSLGGLAEALRGADFSGLKETNDYVREQEREAERSAEKERDIGIDRERGHSL